MPVPAPMPNATHLIYAHDAHDLEAVLHHIRASKRTGSLTIHFSNGTPAGQLEWKERNHEPNHDSDSNPKRQNYLGPIRALTGSNGKK